MADMPKPLAGLKVLEFARILAGPWIGQILADLGAEVIKIESPDGDDTRTWGPPFVQATGAAAYFHSTNRGKQSVVLDFRTGEGRAAAAALAAESDVVIENFKLDGLVKYGLDHASLMSANPRLIYCSITGFGQTGPYAARAGYDFIIQAMSGMMSVTGSPDDEPQKAGYAVSDLVTGLYAVIGIQAALREREQTGCGRHIDMSLMDSSVAVLANQAMNYLVSGNSPKRLGNAHPNIVPYQVFEVTDGHIILAVGNDGQFQRACQVLGLPELAEDARFESNPLRVKHRETLIPQMIPALKRWKKWALLAALEEAGVPAGPINTVGEVFDDPQVRARGLQISHETPDGPIVGVRMPILFDGQPMIAERPGPKLGADTAAVLARLERGKPDA